MTRLDLGWKFLRSDALDAERPEYDDSLWRTVDVPHDWSIEDVPGSNSPFHATASIGAQSTGWAVGGVGWYRKRFHKPPNPGQRTEILFDGVYANCDVWLNGFHLGFHPNGYTPFGYDLTPHLAADGDNVLALRVRNEGSNSRWYSGSGVYRSVMLRETGTVFIPIGGLFVRTPEASSDRSIAHASVEVRNDTSERHAVQVAFVVRGPQGDRVVEAAAEASLEPGELQVLEAMLQIDSPRLWYPWDLLDADASPALYELEAILSAAGETSGCSCTTFGIRTVELDAELGLRINGVPCSLKGGCVHHDNGILGSAAIEGAEVRRVELLRDAGYNAIRTAHNPPSSAFLDACDRLGFLVIDEAFDEWERHKTPASYAGYFADWCEKDIAAMVRRDRNHPSIIFWSIGNEIIESYVRPDLALKLREACLAHDPTRAITQGICKPWWKPVSWVDWDSSSEVAFQHLDAGGYNYEWAVYESDHARHPQRVMMGTESFPIEAYENWDQVVRHPWVIGDFVWTALDYIGESGIGQRYLESDGLKDGAFPYHLAVCGDLDLIGRRKPQSYYREALWRAGVLHATVVEPGSQERERTHEGWHHRWGWTACQSHWNWTGHEGAAVTVEVYSSCERVRLLLNGEEIGEAATGWEERHRAAFEVPYAPGELKVIGFLGDRTFEHVLRTAGDPAAVQLVPNRTAIGARHGELAFVEVRIVDSSGIVVPSSNHEVTVAVEGAGSLIALGNASPTDVSSLQDATHRAYRGILQAVVAPHPRPGRIQMTATSSGLETARCELVTGD